MGLDQSLFLGFIILWSMEKHLSVHPSISLSLFHLSNHQFICEDISLSLWPYIYLCVHPFIYPSIHSTFSLSVHASNHPFIKLSVCPSISLSRLFMQPSVTFCPFSRLCTQIMTTVQTSALTLYISVLFVLVLFIKIKLKNLSWTLCNIGPWS